MTMTKPRASTSLRPTTETEDRPHTGKVADTATRTAAQQITGCRWIDGDVQSPEWRYCQRPRLEGRSYCAAHHARSINPDGDPQFTVEQAEIDHYLCDLPPVDDDEEMDDLEPETDSQ